MNKKLDENKLKSANTEKKLKLWKYRNE